MRPVLAVRWLSIALCLLACGACAGRAHIVKRGQMLMGTIVQVTAVADDSATAERAADAAFAEIHRLENRLSTWIPSSDLSRVNAAAGVEPVVVGPEAFELVRRSLAIAELTGGAFSVTVGPAVQLWNVTEGGDVPTPEALDALRPLLDPGQVRLDAAHLTIFLTRHGMRLDVGGIGKGYAADRAAEVMRKAGGRAGVVALSGDIKTFGRQDGGPFRVGIQHPRRAGALLGTVELENEAISTAGDYERYFERDGVRYHHILDPGTLQPARACQSVTIIAEEGVMADGLDTGIFVMGPERGMALIERLPDVEGIIVAADGTVRVSSGLRNRFKPEPPGQ